MGRSGESVIRRDGSHDVDLPLYTHVFQRVSLAVPARESRYISVSSTTGVATFNTQRAANPFLTSKMRRTLRILFFTFTVNKIQASVLLVKVYLLKENILNI